MFEFILISFSIASLLLVWFNTDAFIEYAKLFGGTKFFHIDDFESKQTKDPTLDWINYLQLNHDSFFTRMITCQLCSGFWLTLASCLTFDKLILLPMCYITSLIVYKLTVIILEF